MSWYAWIALPLLVLSLLKFATRKRRPLARAKQQPFRDYYAPDHWQQFAYEEIVEARDNAETAYVHWASKDEEDLRCLHCKFCLAVWDEFLLTGQVRAGQTFEELDEVTCDHLAAAVAQGIKRIIEPKMMRRTTAQA